MEKKISEKERKKEIVSRLAEKIKKAKVIAIADIHNLPDKHLQAIKKKLRGKAEFLVVKNSLIKRAFEEANKAKELASQMTGPTSIILTDMEPFQFYKSVKKSKGKAAAKPGQIAPYDIVVPAGETTLPPGPILSELKQAGIQAQIQGGKVVIVKDSTVAKVGEKITDAAAKTLQKLGIEPFEIGMNIVAVWENLLYPKSVLDVDEEKLMEQLKMANSYAFNLSFNIAYPTKENIKLLIQKAFLDSKNLAINANIYEKDVIDLLLSKARAQANALKGKVGV